MIEVPIYDPRIQVVMKSFLFTLSDNSYQLPSISRKVRQSLSSIVLPSSFADMSQPIILGTLRRLPNEVLDKVFDHL